MSAELIKRLKAARELKVQIGHITFIGECPLFATCMAIINKFSKTKNSADAELAAESITDWIGVTEADILPGGDATVLVPFDPELFAVLIRDRADWWTPISQEITALVQARQMTKGKELGNLQAGTTPKRSKGSQKPKE